MNRRMLLASAALLLSAAPLWANKAPPPRPAPSPFVKGPQQVKLVVEVDETLKEPRLEIPQGMVVAPLPILPGQPKPGFGADAGQRLPIMVVGLALTAAFVSGGLWLSRRGRSTSLTIALAALVVGGGTLIADVAPPDLRPKPAPKQLTLPAGIELPAKLTLQITDKGDTVKLIVPKSMVLKPTPKPEPQPGE